MTLAADELVAIQSAIMDGIPRKRICEQFEITTWSFDKIRANMIKAGISVPRVMDSVVIAARERAAAMIGMAQSGRSPAEIATEFGMPVRKVQQILRRERHFGRLPQEYAFGRNDDNRSVTDESIRKRRLEIARLAREGYSANQITTMVQVSSKTLRNDLRILKQAHVLEFSFVLSRDGVRGLSIPAPTPMVDRSIFPLTVERFEDDPRAVRECLGFDAAAAARYGSRGPAAKLQRTSYTGCSAAMAERG